MNCPIKEIIVDEIVSEPTSQHSDDFVMVNNEENNDEGNELLHSKVLIELGMSSTY